MNRILEDPNVTRKGKDKGAVRRTLEGLQKSFCLGEEILTD